MDMRPQSHEIIRTWLFATVVRAHLEHGSLPWTNAAISGWILDPDRKKMSKSAGNVVTPLEFFERYGADAVRYWSASARPGADTAFDEGQMKIGRKLAIKILNASKFVLGLAAGDGHHDLGPERITAPVDRALVARLGGLIDEATTAFEAFDYARALERTEQFFWFFCDDYVELVKSRAYGDVGAEPTASARATLALALSTLQRLFAPFLPFVTEEVWSWWQEGSIHRAAWPSPGPLASAAGGADPVVLDTASTALSAVRRAKTEAKKGMRWPVASVTVTDSPERLAALQQVASDLRDAGSVAELRTVARADGAEPSITVELAADPE
jgi:valyl-tRNA synthetase